MKKNLLLSLVSFWLCCVAANADDVILQDGHPDHHVVVKGDTLWDISESFLRDPWLWPEVWQVNPQIANPHLIYPGDRINLVYLDGKPRLRVKRGPMGNTVKLTPKMRLSTADGAISTIPLEKINAFLSRSRIVQQGELEAAPYALAGGQRHLITGAGDEVYARGEFTEGETVYGIYRRGQVFSDPDTNELLGLEATDIGTGKLTELERDLGTLSITRSNEEIRNKDRLLPYKERKITATFQPSSPDSEIDGYIVAVEGGVTQIGFMDIVILNKGDRDGLKEGNVLAIDRAGEVVRDPVQNDLVRLPDVRAGLLMVFRTYEKMSYGLVLRATQPLAVMDRIHNP